MVLIVAGRYLTAADFAFYATTTTSFAVIGLLDLGFGLTAQVHSAGRELGEARGLFLIAARRTGGLALCAFPVGALIAPHTRHPAAFVVCAGLAAVAVPLNLVERWRTQQKQAGANFAASAVAATVSVALTAIAASGGTRAWLPVVSIGALVSVQAAHAAIVLRSTPSSRIVPQMGRTERWTPALLFLGQISAVSIFQYDVLIVNHFASAEATGRFAVLARFAVAGSAVLGAATTAIFPAISADPTHLRRRLGWPVGLVVATLGAAACGAYFRLLRLPLEVAFGRLAPSPGDLIVVLLLLAAFFLTNVVVQVAMARRLLGLQAACAVGVALVKLISSPLLAPRIDPVLLFVVSAAVLLATTVLPIAIAVNWQRQAGNPNIVQ